MKRLLALGIVGVVIVAVGLFVQSEVSVQNVQTEIVEKEVVVGELEKRISDAQNANLSDVEAKAQSAYDSAYNQAMKEIELEVISQYKSEIEVIETELEKEVGVY